MSTHWRVGRGDGAGHPLRWLQGMLVKLLLPPAAPNTVNPIARMAVSTPDPHATAAFAPPGRRSRNTQI